MSIEKRYQVFISSTYRDLNEERQEVIQALLELDCIPSGMELFPATNDDQWTLIKRVIDDCDYYIVIVGGRYGSISPEGISYTEMEYRYALEKSKPIIGFLHKEPDKLPLEKSEINEESRNKLNSFRDLVQKKLIRYYESPKELGSLVSRSLIRLIKDNPSTGWIRGDNLASDAAREEITTLRQKLVDLEQKVKVGSGLSVDEIANLSQGNDQIEIPYKIYASPIDRPYASITFSHKTKVSWNEIFKHISPILIDESSQNSMISAINEYLSARDKEFLTKILFENSKSTYKYVSIEQDAMNGIVIQLFAIGLIQKGTRRRPINDNDKYWKLSESGEITMYQLRAIKKDESSIPSKSPDATSEETITARISDT